MLDLISTHTLLAVLLFAFLAAFITDMISDLVEFDYKISAALATAIVFMVIAGGLTYFYGGDMKQTAIYAGLIFIADLIGNIIVPNRRFWNAFTTGILFAAFVLGYLMSQVA